MENRLQSATIRPTTIEHTYTDTHSNDDDGNGNIAIALALVNCIRADVCVYVCARELFVLWFIVCESPTQCVNERIIIRYINIRVRCE